MSSSKLKKNFPAGWAVELAASCLLISGWLALGTMQMLAAPRARISIDDNWRFTKGDPTNVNSRNLLYDVRPVASAGDQKEPLAEATAEAAKLSAVTNPVLKPWILSSGNAFIKDPAKRFVRPEGNPGGEVACAQNDFDDGGGQRVNLPHDWAIAGPFNSLPGRVDSCGFGHD